LNLTLIAETHCSRCGSLWTVPFADIPEWIC
jgi:hypothetical protein